MDKYLLTTLYSSSLKKDKKIYVYLPKDYETSTESYPVLYMHDGQNLFDNSTSYAGKSWGIVENYEKYPDLPKLIIVGIESDDERSDELLPAQFTYFGTDIVQGGKADLYLDFITTELKSYIDKTYRTLPDPLHTALMGSSFGGVNTLYASLAFEKFFTRYGVISNAYLFPGFKDMMDDLLEKKVFTNVLKMWLDVGTKEHEREDFRLAYINNNKALADTLSSKLQTGQFHFGIYKDAIHHESEWDKRFREIVLYLFND